MSPFEHFFIPGAQRSATSYLAKLLDGHPEVDMAQPLRPEPKYFLRTAGGTQTIPDYYRRHFSGSASARVRGEKSTTYIESPSAAAAIARTFPQAKFVIVLRDPVERAISNYLLSLQSGLEDLPAASALLDPAAEARRFDTRISASPFHYVRRGRYVDYLREYLEQFGRSQLHIVLTENLVSDSTVFTGILEFLGVDPDFRPADAATPVNISEADPSGGTTELHTVRERLAGQFREANTRLAREFDLDLSPWQ